MPQEKEDKIKKKISILILALVFLNISYSFSQSNYGIFGGLNYSGLRGREGAPYNKHFFLYNTGFFAEFQYGISSTLQIEVKYDARGGMISDSIDHFINGFYNVTEELKYISLPITYKYYFKQKKFQLFAFYGGAFSYMTENKRTIYAESSGVPVNVTFLFDYDYKFYSLDLFAGFGFGFKRIGFDFKYLTSINSIYKGKSAIIKRHNIFSFNIYYRIIKKKKVPIW